MRLLCISLDACYQADAQTLLSLPHLGALAHQGVFCGNVQTIYPTITYPIHASLLTGCYPDKHGIAHNHKFQPNTPSHLRPWYWESKDIKAPTLLSQGAKAGRSAAAILWPTTGKDKTIANNFPEALALPGENQAVKIMKYGSFWWILKNELLIGRQRVSTAQPHLDNYATLLCQQLLLKEYSPKAAIWRRKGVQPSRRRMMRRMPDMIFLHLVSVDAMRHKYGVHSKEAKDALIHLDTLVGQLLFILQDRDAFKDTIIAVVSDHGQADVQKTVNLNALIKEAGVPCIAQSLGFGAYIHCARDVRRQVFEYLDSHKEQLFIARALDRAALDDLRVHPSIPLAVDAVRGVEFIDNDGASSHKANHGFPIDWPEARTLFWLSGPGIKRNARLDACNLVDIAPTMAAACGLSLPDADGRILTELFERG